MAANSATRHRKNTVPAGENILAARSRHATAEGVPQVPLVIGVTGHRDLLAQETEFLRKQVREFFLGLQADFPDLPLQVLSPLAEGADRLVAEEARALGIPLIVPLPMGREFYVNDFADAESVAEFDRLCEGAEVLALPLAEGTTDADLEGPGGAKDMQYARLGVFVCAHCHILLALWDGKPGENFGGTAQVVRFHQDDVMPGLTADTDKPRLILADDDSDLVYHIACSRDLAEGATEAPLRPGEVCWYTSDRQSPRSTSLPDRYARIFRRTAEFNQDARKIYNPTEHNKYALAPEGSTESAERSTRVIDDMFLVADTLAIYYQQRFFRMLRITHILAALMGMTYILYFDVFGSTDFILAYLGLFGLGVILFTMAKRGSWHRKYLDYRALAEGLRVEFYWAAADVHSSEGTMYTHDNFLQKQDVELGWIRNVMRVAGIYIDVDDRVDPQAGLEWVIDEWIGGRTKGGQLGYYSKHSEKRERLNRMTEVVGWSCLVGGILVAVMLAIFRPDSETGLGLTLNVLMGVLPLAAAIRFAYAHKKADKELVKQYRFMSRIFANARRRINATKNPAAQRDILKALGDAALDEHADWILIHRERPLEISGGA